MRAIKIYMQRRTPVQVARRAERMATHDLFSWADGCINAVGRSLSESQRAAPDEAKAWIDNAHLEAVAAVALLEELRNRL